MERIKSFEVNHNTLHPGLYISRTDGDVTTYDLRFVRPNTPPFLSTASIHTIEHLFATYVRNSRWKDEVIYFGPMGCRTGFYFLVRHIPAKEVIGLIQQALSFIAGFSGQIPGASPEECGNYREHDLEGAKKDAQAMLEKVKDWKECQLNYNAMAE